METASSSVLKAQKEREREWPLLKLEAPLHSGKLTYLLISAKVQQVMCSIYITLFSHRSYIYRGIHLHIQSRKCLFLGLFWLEDI